MIEQAVVLDLMSHSQRLSCGFYQKARRDGRSRASIVSNCLLAITKGSSTSAISACSRFPSRYFLSRWCSIRLATVATRYTTALFMKDFAQPTSMADQSKLSCRYSCEDLLLRCNIG